MCADCSEEIGPRRQKCDSCVARAMKERWGRRTTRRAVDPAFVARRSEIDRLYRERLRGQAIAAMGGVCMHCGFDNPLALQFDHIVPLMRRTSGIAKRKDSDRAYRAIVNGEIGGIQLLCANCHVIKTKMVDNRGGTLMRNIKAEAA